MFVSVHQKKVLNLLVDILNQCKRAQPASSAVHIKRMEDFEQVEQRIRNAKAFDALVGFRSLKIMDSLAQCLPTPALHIFHVSLLQHT